MINIYLNINNGLFLSNALEILYWQQLLNCTVNFSSRSVDSTFFHSLHKDFATHDECNQKPIHSNSQQDSLWRRRGWTTTAKHRRSYHRFVDSRSGFLRSLQLHCDGSVIKCFLTTWQVWRLFIHKFNVSYHATQHCFQFDHCSSTWAQGGCVQPPDWTQWYCNAFGRH